MKQCIEEPALTVQLQYTVFIMQQNCDTRIIASDTHYFLQVFHSILDLPCLSASLCAAWAARGKVVSLMSVYCFFLLLALFVSFIVPLSVIKNILYHKVVESLC